MALAGDNFVSVVMFEDERILGLRFFVTDAGDGRECRFHAFYINSNHFNLNMTFDR
jgi:hypothetical protein